MEFTGRAGPGLADTQRAVGSLEGASAAVAVQCWGEVLLREPWESPWLLRGYHGRASL